MRWHLVSVSALLLAALPAAAQVKFPVYEEDSGVLKKVVFEEATRPSDFQHGRVVQLTLTNDSEKPIRGVLVRVDRAKRLIYVRTEPGARPRAIAEKDIKRIDKGVIRLVGHNQDVLQPEIQQLTIINGTQRSTSYIAPTISSSERNYLANLEAAENEVTRLESLAARDMKVLDNDIAIQTEQLRTQELINWLLLRYNDRFVLPQSTVLWNAPVQGLPSAIRQGPTVFPHLPVPLDALAKARQSLTTAQANLVYEGGTLVAVVVDEPTK